MRAAVALLAILTAGGATAAAADDDDIIYELSDDEYYSMPTLFKLDDWAGCAARDETYCLGSFELSPLSSHSPHTLFNTMRRYSNHWVDHFNHTRLHRGVCLPKSCQSRPQNSTPEEWFTSCVNTSTSREYRLEARPLRIEYCRNGGYTAPQLISSERALAAVIATLLALAALSTALDLYLPVQAKKRHQWALAWSLPGCWHALTDGGGEAKTTEAKGLRALDGVRVLCMACVIIEHVAWLNTTAYSANPRFTETQRSAPDVQLMTNSTLVVQIFFVMSSFLLAHKLLRMPVPTAPIQAILLALRTMRDRVIRISPLYWVVVWWAASGWWGRLGSGPQWSLVEAEQDVCRRKWWTHLLYLNNVVQPDDKCLIQTWYLAADMQLYAGALVLTLLLRCLRVTPRVALVVLTSLLFSSIALLGALAYMWRLIPTFIMHRPESIRVQYAGDTSFNVLYQSPLGNAPGALAGLLLAHAHHALLQMQRPPKFLASKAWQLCAWWSVPCCVFWALFSPRLVGGATPPPRAAAAALATLERPVFAAFVSCALLGAMHGVTLWGDVFGWPGWRVWARLSFGALLLHMPINKSLVSARLQPTQLDRANAIVEWWGIAAVSYALATPLALLVEYPAVRLLRAFTMPRCRRKEPAADKSAPTT